MLFGLHRFYIYIQQDLWSGEQAAVVRAQQEAGISDVKKVYKSVWDEVCWVVEGKDESGQAVMVWIQEGKESRVVLSQKEQRKPRSKRSYMNAFRKLIL